MKEKLQFKFSVDDIVSLGKTSKEKIKEIESWLPTAPHECVPPEIQKEMIVLFLLSCDNDIELTKKTITSHYKLRKEAPDIFDERKMDRKDIQKAFNTLRMVYLPGRTVDNNAIIYFRLNDTYYKNFESNAIMKASFMLMDLELTDIPPDGVIYLVDMEGFGLMHLTRLKPDTMKKYFDYLGEGLPMKFFGMHFMNANYVLEKFLAIIRVFLPANLTNKLYKYPPGMPLEELYKIVPKACLPHELGGDSASVEELFEKTLVMLNEKIRFVILDKKCFI